MAGAPTKTSALGPPASCAWATEHTNSSVAGATVAIRDNPVKALAKGLVNIPGGISAATRRRTRRGVNGLTDSGRIASTTCSRGNAHSRDAARHTRDCTLAGTAPRVSGGWVPSVSSCVPRRTRSQPPTCRTRSRDEYTTKPHDPHGDNRRVGVRVRVSSLLSHRQTVTNGW